MATPDTKRETIEQSDATVCKVVADYYHDPAAAYKLLMDTLTPLRPGADITDTEIIRQYDNLLLGIFDTETLLHGKRLRYNTPRTVELLRFNLEPLVERYRQFSQQSEDGTGLTREQIEADMSQNEIEVRTLQTGLKAAKLME